MAAQPEDTRPLDKLGRPYTPRSMGNGIHAPDDPETLALLRDAIVNDGLTPRSAAEAIGIPQSTFYDWMAASTGFSEAMKANAAQLKRRLSKYVMSAAPTQWQAAMTTMERLWPEEYGRKDRIQHQHQGQVGLVVSPAAMDVESIMLAAQLEERMALGDQAQKALPAHEEDS